MTSPEARRPATRPADRPRSRRPRPDAVRKAAFDLLENRTLFAVNLGADGWTTFTPSADSQVIYVSTSGSDTNSGTSQSSPLRSLGAAKRKLRDGKPDWILLKRGDVWNDAFGSIKVSGRSTDEPIYFGAYGTGARPQIRTGGGDGIATIAGNTVPVNYVAVQGLHFIDHTHQGTEPNTALRFQRKGTGIYIEDVRVENFKDGMVFSGETAPDAVSNIKIRRSVIHDNWQKSPNHAQGIYASGVTNGITIEESVLDHNGWKDGVAGAYKTIYNHNIYINSGAQNVVIRNNISTRGALRGILSRGGGVITGNFTARNAIGIETWGNATISNNVVMENGDIPNYPQGFGIQVKESNGNVTIDNNVIAHDWSDFTYNVFGIRIWNGLNSATVTNNILYDWRRPFFYDTYGRNTQLVVQNNQFQVDDGYHAVVAHQGGRLLGTHNYENNKYYSPRGQPMWQGNTYLPWSSWQTQNGGEDNSAFQRQTYLDPNRTLGDYNATLGNSRSFDAFMEAAKNLSRSNYSLNYTAAPVIEYIREGFNLGTVSGPQVSVDPTDNVAKEPVATPAAPANPGTFTITRTGAVTGDLVVNYAFGGTATYGTDYTATLPETGTLTIPAGQSSITVTITPLADTTAENPETVDFRLVAGGSYGLGAPSLATINIEDGNGGTIPPVYGSGGDGRGGGFIGYPYDPVNSGTGLKGEYFNNADFTDLRLQRLDLNVNFDWGLGAPVSTPLEPDTFSVRWTGNLIPDSAHEGTINFRIEADNAARLWIDDILIIDTISAGRFPGDANQDGIVNIADFAIVAANFNTDGRSWETGDFNGDEEVTIADFAALAANFNQTAPAGGNTEGSFFLEDNYVYSFRLDYVEYTGASKIKLFWTNNDDVETILPTANLFAPSDVLPDGVLEGAASVAAAPPPAAKTRFSSVVIGEDEPDALPA